MSMGTLILDAYDIRNQKLEGPASRRTQMDAKVIGTGTGGSSVGCCNLETVRWSDFDTGISGLKAKRA